MVSMPSSQMSSRSDDGSDPHESGIILLIDFLLVHPEVIQFEGAADA